jgi:hypothetical protein
MSRSTLAAPTRPGAASPAEAAVKGPSHPLDARTRERMQPVVGYDLGRVRVHTDAPAAESARSLRARAYTLGEHVVFARGAYAPGTPAGDRLLAHEVAHVAQAYDGRVGEPRALSDAGPRADPLEAEADRLADAASRPSPTPAQAVAFRAPPPVRAAAVLRAKDETAATVATPATPGRDPAGDAQPAGIFAQSRPFTNSFSVDNFPGASFETGRFTVDNGTVTVNITADWVPPSTDAPRTYMVMLLKWGLLSDSMNPRISGVSVGRPERISWSDLASGSYYVRVVPHLNVATNSHLEGTLTVS